MSVGGKKEVCMYTPFKSLTILNIFLKQMI